MADQTPTQTSPDYASPTTPRAGHVERRVVHHAEMPEEHPERHEQTDVSVRGIWITVGAVLVTTAIVHVIMYFVFFAYEGAQAAQDDAERRSAITDVVIGPPEEIPRLQGIQSFNAETPAVDQRQLEQENRQLLNSYGTTPDGRGRIPVNRAMDIALERKMFHTRGAAATQATTQPGGADARP